MKYEAVVQDTKGKIKKLTFNSLEERTNFLTDEKHGDWKLFSIGCEGYTLEPIKKKKKRYKIIDTGFKDTEKGEEISQLELIKKIANDIEKLKKQLLKSG